MTWKKQEGMGFWSPEKEGDELVGEVTSVDTEGEYGTRYMIRNEDGDEVITPSHKVLQNRMLKAKKGDKVKIVYKGTEPPSVKGYSPTQIYEVFIDQ